MEDQAAEGRAAAAQSHPARQSDALRRVESRFIGYAGIPLFRRSWLPTQPVRVLAVVHGFGEHSGRYEHVGAWFARRGTSVHAFDLRGHGRSPGRRGHVDHFADYLNDLECFLDRVREEAAELPVTLVGHSMGGLIATAFAVERSPRVQSLVTSGAALQISPDLSPLKVHLARLLKRVVPRLAMDAGLDSNAICSDPDVVRRYVEDPLVHGTTTTAHAAAMFDQMDRIRGAGAQVEVPMFLAHGADDRLCSPAGSTAFYQSLPGAAEPQAAPRAALRIYSRSSHELFNDVEQQVVFEDVLEWIEQCETAASEPPQREVQHAQ